MNGDPNEVLIEQAISAYREQDPSGRIIPSSAWWDLPPESREELFVRQLEARIIERELAPGGRSATVQAVLVRLGRV